MRDNVVNEHSTVGKSAECKKQVAEHNANLKPGQKPAKGYTDLPAARRKKVDAAVSGQVAKRQKGLKKAQKKAIECIVDAWKQSLDEMRNDVVDKYSVAAKSQACKDQIAAHNKKLPRGAPCEDVQRSAQGEAGPGEQEPRGEGGARQEDKGASEEEGRHRPHGEG